MAAFLLRFDEKNKVYLEIEKPYFQLINLNRKAIHLIFILLPYCSPKRPY